MSVRKIVSTAKNPRRRVRWEARWSVGEQQVTKRFDTREESVAYEARMRTGLADGSYVPPDRAKVTFGE